MQERKMLKTVFAGLFACDRSWILKILAVYLDKAVSLDAAVSLERQGREEL